jgi:hypothetical protein
MALDKIDENWKFFREISSGEHGYGQGKRKHEQPDIYSEEEEDTPVKSRLKKKKKEQIIQEVRKERVPKVHFH